MSEVISPPSLFFKRGHNNKRQTIVDLIGDEEACSTFREK